MKIQLNNVPISDNDDIIEPQSEETNPGSSRSCVIQMFWEHLNKKEDLWNIQKITRQGLINIGMKLKRDHRGSSVINWFAFWLCSVMLWLYFDFIWSWTQNCGQ